MDAYIIKGYRTAVGRSNKGSLRFFRSDDMATEVIKHMTGELENLDTKKIDDVIVGCAVPEAAQGMQMGRMISLLSLPKEVSGMLVNRYCGSGIEAISIAAAKIHAGLADCIIAGGAESMSMVPMLGYKVDLNHKLATEYPDYYSSMGITAEMVAQHYKITRDQQDEFAFNSHQKAIDAINTKKFESQIVPLTIEENYLNSDEKLTTRSSVFDTDEGPRLDTSMEALGKLRAVFSNGGSVTAGNSSQTSDGAAFVMVVSEKMLKELKVEPIARMMSYSTAGVEPKIMGIGPVEAIPKALSKAGLKLTDIDQIELNEAFAAQALAVIQEAELNPYIVNVNGGAIALGHPLGCTGAKLSIQLFNEMKLRKQKYGMVTACVGGGQGVAGIYEVY